MEWSVIGLNFVYAVSGVILMWLCYRILDWVTPQNDPVRVELGKGNIAVAIFMGSLFLSIAIIIAGALN